MAGELQPTLWRTARVLANARRLRVLAVVFSESPIAVSVVGERCGLAVDHASQILRALQARGLLRARRIGPYVLYVPDADPSVAFADELLAVLRRVIHRRDADFRPIIAALTAYTHPRRPVIVRAIAGGADRACEVSRACGISRMSVSRHIDKLRRRGVIEQRGERLRLRRQRTPLAAVLLGLVLRSDA